MVVIAQEADPIAHVIATIGSAAFGSACHSLVEGRLGVRRCHVFSFAKRSRPICVLVQASSAEVSKSAQSLASDYVGGDYHCDPLLRELKHAPAGNVWFARTGPSNVENRYFRSKYYDGSGIADEIAIFSETDDHLLYAGFCRQEDETPFSGEEFRRILEEAPVVLNSVSRHLEILSLRERLEPSAHVVPNPHKWTLEEKRRHYFVKVRDTLLDSGCCLTPREAEICAYVVQGYLANAIAGMLGISVDTVATHRKHAYAKLGVSRQNELFSKYVDLLTDRPAHQMLVK